MFAGAYPRLAVGLSETAVALGAGHRAALCCKKFAGACPRFAVGLSETAFALSAGHRVHFDHLFSNIFVILRAGESTSYAPQALRMRSAFRMRFRVLCSKPQALFV